MIGVSETRGMRGNMVGTEQAASGAISFPYNIILESVPSVSLHHTWAGAKLSKKCFSAENHNPNYLSTQLM